MLTGSADADVCVVGAGFTGLWAAYYLIKADPTLRVVVLEREVAGFGASGRNGGWCSALFPASLTKVERESDRAGAVALYRALAETVDEVGAVATAEGIDCHYAKGGTLVLARSELQLERARAEVDEARRFGLGEEDVRLLDRQETERRFAATKALGAAYTPHCATIHPSRLVRGLARAVEARGVRIAELTPATRIERGSVHTPFGQVRAPVVVRATEGYTRSLPGFKRALAPVYSLMLATEPLSAEAWKQIGLAERETFSDHRHMIIYGQRTADGRLAFGGRGAPYHYGSQVRGSYDREPAVFADLRRTLGDLLPATRDVAATHTWGGALGVPRDWFASVTYDRASGLATAGGYVGDGVGASNLAGRTLADLVLGHDTDRTHLPWVGHRSGRWEPEPLRWLGINAGLHGMTFADAAEERTGRTSRVGKVLGRLVGA